MQTCGCNDAYCTYILVMARAAICQGESIWGQASVGFMIKDLNKHVKYHSEAMSAMEGTCIGQSGCCMLYNNPTRPLHCADRLSVRQSTIKICNEVIILPHCMHASLANGSVAVQLGTTGSAIHVAEETTTHTQV